MNQRPTPIYLPNATLTQRPASVKTSAFAVVLLAMVMNSSLISVMGSKIGYFSTTIGHLVSAGAMVSLIAFSMTRSTRMSQKHFPASLMHCLILLVCVILLHGVLGYSTSLLPRDLQQAALIKSFGSILTIAALTRGALAYRRREIQNALVLFAIVEMIGSYLLYRSGADVNPNTISVRASVAGMCLFALLPNRLLCFAALGVSLAFSVVLGCRTSAVALVGAVVFLYFERTSRKNRGPTLLMVFGGAVLLLMLSSTIISAIQSLLLQSLGSDNLLADFFLHDKSAQKVRTDYLDRSSVWEASWKYIQRRPFLGYGLGSERELMGARSHNAYLSVLFEGGFVLFAAWMTFYLRIIANVFNDQWVMRVGQSKLFYLAMMLLGYMLLAGIVESSGLASVSTPVNVVFIFLAIWLLNPFSEQELLLERNG